MRRMTCAVDKATENKRATATLQKQSVLSDVYLLQILPSAVQRHVMC